MKTLADWGRWLLLATGSWAYYTGLEWWKEQKREANRGECGFPPRRRGQRPAYAELPTEEWCPAHDSWYGPETECPGCREEWEQTWTLGEEPEEQQRRDDWSDQQEERAQSDAWYQDLIARSEGRDPHHPWRD
jgi:hypothetical protein